MRANTWLLIVILVFCVSAVGGYLTQETRPDLCAIFATIGVCAIGVLIGLAMKDMKSEGQALL